MKIDIGRLTQEETAELLKECISALPTDQAITAIVDALEIADREELVEAIEVRR